MEDRQFHACMERMRAGDKEALHEVYEAYIGFVYSVVLRVLQNREDAEDVTSEFFIKLWRLADVYESRRGHRAWMAAVARNMAVDLVRKRKRELLTDDFSEGIPEQTAGDDVEREVLSGIHLEQALELLRPGEREVVNLKIMGDLTFREIADILELPMGTVTWQYQNAIKKLRRCGYE
ncbi:MAG: sigma-70 family RNA polymerase sigma factor [Roseburia sp.]|nr:sigma-70 family RNA polymerase sigma factor [Roseburia sp.]MCM1099554.1 sigma-70 family RNA polymerase sigma factor [Ruminococcus flavefaciens]